MKCRLCASDCTKFLLLSENIHGRHLLSHETFGVYACQACGVIFTDVKIDDNFYSKYYLPDYYNEGPENLFVKSPMALLRKISYSRRQRLIKRYSPLGKTVLEIGCGKGDFLAFLPAFYKKYGVEINPSGYEYVQKHYPDISIFNKKISEDALPGREQKYDIIGLWHVFEHLDNPNSFLKTIKNILSPNGILVFDIPNAASLGFRWTKKFWFHLDTPRHLFLYDRKCIQGLMKKHDLKIVHYSASPIDYFQDLSLSFYNILHSKNSFLNVVTLLIFLPVTLLIRIVVSFLFPASAEINSYVVKHNP